jgi:hypothetical protein
VKPRAMWIFYTYTVWIAVCLLSFATSTLLGFITVALGIALRLLETAVAILRELLVETRQTRLELRAQRLTPRDDPRD